jgi:hypothetical protein
MTYIVSKASEKFQAFMPERMQKEWMIMYYYGCLTKYNTRASG